MRIAALRLSHNPSVSPAVARDLPVPENVASVWPPRRSIGGEAALWVAAALIVLALVTLAVLLTGTLAPGPTMFELALVGTILALAGYGILLWALSYRRLNYVLGPTSLDVPWLGERVVIPYTAIEGIYTGQRLGGHAAPSGVRWPGIVVGRGRTPAPEEGERSLGRLQFFATSADPETLTLVAVEGGALVVSARDPQGFRSALIEQVRRQDALTAGGVEESQLLPATTAPWSSLRDRWFWWCLGVALVLLLAVLAVVALRYGDLAEQIPMRFDSGGRATAFGPPTDLLRLPLGGLIVLVLNLALGIWAHPRERVVARMLWAGSGLVQAILLIAVVRLVQ
jgi:hypothetical protein